MLGFPAIGRAFIRACCVEQFMSYDARRLVFGSGKRVCTEYNRRAGSACICQLNAAALNSRKWADSDGGKGTRRCRMHRGVFPNEVVIVILKFRVVVWVQ